LASLPLTADTNENIGLQQIKTEFFTIIYPPAARESAERLSGFADELYRQVAQVLEVPTRLHIPVYFNAETEVLNGSYSPITSPRIQLYQAHISPGQGFALFDDPLKSLFLHELVHAVSLNISPDWWRVLSGIFYQGGFGVSVTAPNNLVEGVTVSFESINGAGRANDTPYAAVIQQDIIEGRFRSFHESSGMQSGAPGGLWYIYGGWFSRYLLERYGLESYAALWHEIGKFNHPGPFLFSKGAVYKVTGHTMDQVWEGFRSWMSIRKPVSTDLYPIDGQDNYYDALEADAQFLYVADSLGIRQIDQANGSSQRLLSGDYGLNRISVSADGNQLLLSGTALANAAGDLALRLWILDIASGRLRVLKTPDRISEAAWGPGDSIIAIQGRGYTADLVRLEPATDDPYDYRALQVLFSGDNGILPALPQLWQNVDILFILGVHGQNRLALLPHGLPGDPKILETEASVQGIRHLWANNKEALFIYDNDLSLFKLGRLRLTETDGELLLTLQQTPLSGGVQYPVLAGARIYYIAKLSGGQRLMAYPEGSAAVADKTTGSWLARAEAARSAGLSTPALYAASLQQNSTVAKWSAEVFSATSASATHLANSTAAPYFATTAANIDSVRRSKYHPLLWALTPSIRYPLLDINTAAEDIAGLVRGAGLGMLSVDPSGWLTLNLQAGWNWRDGMAPAKLQLDTNNRWGTLSFLVSDSIRYFMDSTGTWAQRTLQGGISAASQFAPGPLNSLFGISARIDALAASFRQLDDSMTPPSLYNEALSQMVAGSVVSASWQKVSATPQIGSRRGFAVQANWQAVMDPLMPALPEAVADLGLRIFFPGLGAAGGPGLAPQLELVGAIATHPEVRISPSGYSSTSGIIRNATAVFMPYSGYAGVSDLASFWYAGFDASLGPSFRVNAILPGAVYVSEATVRAGYRGAWVGGIEGRWLDTAYVRLYFELLAGDRLTSSLPVQLGIETGWHLQYEYPLYVGPYISIGL
ncbi:MAG: hypothetical protein KKI09_10135, partial [Spirochaetes bacterium]|nr:hypothetical protein [Spirochaetota bacterium]